MGADSGDVVAWWRRGAEDIVESLVIMGDVVGEGR
jgi:hypothetical protein